MRPGTEVPDVHAAQGLSWAVQDGTTLQEALAEAIEPSAPAQVLEHQREVLLALRVGRAQAVMLDLPVALAYAREAPAHLRRRGPTAERSRAGRGPAQGL